MLALFVALVMSHDRVIKEERRVTALVELCQEALARLDRRWEALPRRLAPEGAAQHPVARDLDLFAGAERRAALFDLVGTVHTPMGRQTLAEWLLDPASPEVVSARQEAVRELGPLVDWRQDLGVRGRRMLGLPSEVEPFLQWAEGEPWLRAKPWRLWLPRLLCGVTLALVSLNVAGLLPPWWLLAVAANLILSGLLSRMAHAVFDQVAWREKAFREFEGLFEPLAETPFDAPLLGELKERLLVDGVAAHQQMRRLDRIIGFADARRSGLVYLLLEGLTLWDFHVLAALERWQGNVGRRVRSWFVVLGEVEALAALAALHHDHPAWCFPEIRDEGDARIKGVALGHPLFPGDRCVRNDVEVGPPGTFLLVTGSNMSGKSTLLRGIGLNAVLAQAGGPVCAEAFSLPPVRLGTSFRVEDSLEAGVSFFMAELRRLKAIVDEAAACSDVVASSDVVAWRYLFLLDEILQGTNVYERQIAVRHVLSFLMGRGAIGAISTHDLTLAERGELASAVRAVHFTEDYQETQEGPRMTFDYLLRKGVAPTTNALKLLALVGLGEDMDGAAVSLAHDPGYPVGASRGDASPHGAESADAAPEGAGLGEAAPGGPKRR